MKEDDQCTGVEWDYGVDLVDQVKINQCRGRLKKQSVNDQKDWIEWEYICNKCGLFYKYAILK